MMKCVVYDIAIYTLYISLVCWRGLFTVYFSIFGMLKVYIGFGEKNCVCCVACFEYFFVSLQDI